MEALAHDAAYVGALHKRGFSKIGGGLYSTVLAKYSEDYVIKVARLDRWPEYIRWATSQGYAGTFAPKVYGLKYYETFYVATMERLVCTIEETKAAIGRDRNPYHKAHMAVKHWARDYSMDNVPDYPDLEAFIKACYHAGFGDDLHDGNLMLRKDGQIVLIDPSSNHSDYRFRIKSGKIIEKENSHG